MPRRRVIRPTPVEDWPTLFWERAESSFADNDLACGRCVGRGLRGEPPGHRLCLACLGSGLILPRREPADPDALVGVEIAWTAVAEEDVRWPEVPYAWLVGRAGVRHRGFVMCDGGVVGWVHCGQILLGLTAWVPPADARRLLLSAYRGSAGRDAEGAHFVIPRSRSEPPVGQGGSGDE